MNEFATVLSAVLPIFGLMVIGLGVRKLNWLTEEADSSLLRVNVNLLLPCLIFDSALGNPALSQVQNLLLAPAFGYASVALGIGLALACGALHGSRERPAVRTFAVCVGIYNYGYIPLPLTLLLFDKATAGVLFLVMMGVEAALWTLGVWTFTGGSLGQSWRRIINAPLLAIILALVLNTLGLNAHLPKPLITGVHWLGQCAIPMALILIGAMVADHLHEFHSKSGWRVIGAALLLRIGVLPVLFLLVARFLPASVELKRVMVLEAAMPAAVFPIVLSRHYGGDPATAMRVVIGTSVVGLATIPLWIRFGMKFVGL
ncbi:MAG TPA: AEC family transporter [Verrucomicrobiae bacterium]|nr:AEC family transporter [Verrucomicrobiae bacterium]